MSVLEQPGRVTPSPGTPGEGRGKGRRPLSSSPSKSRSRFAVYFIKRGWIHALLLLFVWLFLFPFLWMVSTSIKTDDEMTSGSLIPQIPTFRAVSPYVREIDPPTKPLDCPSDVWKNELPKLRDLASQSLASYQKSHPASPTLGPFDAADHNTSATTALLDFTIGRLNKSLWTGPEPALLNAFKQELTDEVLSKSLDRSLARLEFLGFQIRTLDVHIYNLTSGKDFAKDWKIESGPAKFIPQNDSSILTYNFPNSFSAPIVIKHDFDLPPGVTPKDIHKIMLPLICDDSWHRIDVAYDTPDAHYQAERPFYIAQHRPATLLLQPPTFDDQSLRPKTWLSLIPISSNNKQLTTNNKQLTLTLTLSPSSTPRSIWGKIRRNYDRAFYLVPFWTYISNSVILVALCTLGSLFSASFVAYAFARLNWPGRSTAFLILLCTMMLPSQVTMIPSFLIWRSLHWYNTLNPLWVPTFFGGAFFIFLMTQHMKTIPKELEEAARLDGLSAIQSWWYIILPNVKPTLAAIAILSFMGAWNDFMGPLIFLRDQSKFPLALGLYGLKIDFALTSPDWTLVMAGNMLMTLPVIVVFFLFQRYFVQGMTLTGMKG